MLPFLGLGGIIAGAFLGKIAADVANDEREELNNINREIDSTAEYANSVLKDSQSAFKNKLLNLLMLRDNIYKTSLDRFIQCTKGIRDLENLPEFDKYIEFNELEIAIENYKTNSLSTDFSSWRASNSAAVITALSGSVGGAVSFGASMFDYLKTSFKIDEANTELSRVQVQSELIMTKTDAMDTIVELYKLVENTIRDLDNLFCNELLYISHIKMVYGTSYVKYPSEIKQQLRTVFNLAHGIFSLLKYDFIDSDGLPNKRFLKSNQGNSIFFSNADYDYKYICKAISTLREAEYNE